MEPLNNTEKGILLVLRANAERHVKPLPADPSQVERAYLMKTNLKFFMKGRLVSPTLYDADAKSTKDMVNPYQCTVTEWEEAMQHLLQHGCIKEKTNTSHSKTSKYYAITEAGLAALGNNALPDITAEAAEVLRTGNQVVR
jgi:hypothetical protein